MGRYFLFFQYNGAAYHGWQKQENAITVQELIEDALAKYFSTPIEIVGAGRTDTGVHAKLMVAHMDIGIEVNTSELKYRLNGILPNDIAILQIKAVKSDFHARFSALSRYYEYKVVKSKSPFEPFAHQVFFDLDIHAMNQAAQYFIGEHDFSSFSKSHTQTHTNLCTVHFAEWKQEGECLIFSVKANRFLRNMVRAMVGTLLEVGMHKRKADEIPDLLAAKNRSKAGVSVPANGLALVDIEYPSEGFI